MKQKAFEVQRSLPFDPPPPEAPTVETPTNLRDLSKQVELVLHRELSALISEALPDIKIAAEAIAPVLVSAALAGDANMVGELQAQLELLTETQRIRGVKGGIRILNSVTSSLYGGLTIGLQAILRAI